MNINIFSLLTVISLFACGLVFAGTTGKIAGTVFDVDTKEPIPGAVATILGTNLGANTDLQGRFMIVNVPTGTYTVEARMMCYKTIDIYHVCVLPGQTSKIQFNLSNSLSEKIQLSIQSLKVRSDSLKQTIITPYLDAPIEPNKNLIYCATFQLAWNELKNNIIHQNIELEGNPIDARLLNKQLFDKHEIDKNYYVARSGKLSQSLINSINSELQKKFGQSSPDTLQMPAESFRNIFLSYAYLSKNLHIPHKFNAIDGTIRFLLPDCSIDVKSFGISSADKTLSKELRKQVTVLYYNSDDDFAIRLQTTSTKDELILTKTNPSSTLSNTIDQLEQNISNHHEASLNEDDGLSIPYLDFDIEHSYDQLTHRNLLNNGWREYYIEKALQNIKFQLDEGGATLVSTATIIMITGIPPRLFVFNKPFIILLRQKGSKHPYFAMWVANPELLVKY